MNAAADGRSVSDSELLTAAVTGAAGGYMVAKIGEGIGDKFTDETNAGKNMREKAEVYDPLPETDVAQRTGTTNQMIIDQNTGKNTGNNNLKEDVNVAQDAGKSDTCPLSKTSYGKSSENVAKGGSESVYIPRDSEGNPIPLMKQRINGQDIPLPDPVAEGRPHTVLGGKVSSETGEVYRQSATFPGGTWPSANGYDVPWSEVHWGIMADHLLLDRMEDLLVILILMNIFSIMILIIIIGIERIQAHFIDDRGDDKYGLLY